MGNDDLYRFIDSQKGIYLNREGRLVFTDGVTTDEEGYLVRTEGINLPMSSMIRDLRFIEGHLNYTREQLLILLTVDGRVIDNNGKELLSGIIRLNPPLNIMHECFAINIQGTAFSIWQFGTLNPQVQELRYEGVLDVQDFDRYSFILLHIDDNLPVMNLIEWPSLNDVCFASLTDVL